jgi:hypothetical protein
VWQAAAAEAEAVLATALVQSASGRAASAAPVYNQSSAALAFSAPGLLAPAAAWPAGLSSSRPSAFEPSAAHRSAPSDAGPSRAARFQEVADPAARQIQRRWRRWVARRKEGKMMEWTAQVAPPHSPGGMPAPKRSDWRGAGGTAALAHPRTAPGRRRGCGTGERRRPVRPRRPHMHRSLSHVRVGSGEQAACSPGRDGADRNRESRPAHHGELTHMSIRANDEMPCKSMRESWRCDSAAASQPAGVGSRPSPQRVRTRYRSHRRCAPAAGC